LTIIIANIVSVKGDVPADKVTTLTNISFSTTTYSGYLNLTNTKRLHYVFTLS